MTNMPPLTPEGSQSIANAMVAALQDPERMKQITEQAQQIQAELVANGSWTDPKTGIRMEWKPTGEMVLTVDPQAVKAAQEAQESGE